MELTDKITYKYDEEFKKIEFYEKYPEYLPYVGDKYEEYRILQVAESHYIPQKSSDIKFRFDIQYFKEHWWKGDVLELYGAYTKDEENVQKWINTRLCITEFVDRTVNSNAYNVYRNFMRAFNKEIFNQDDARDHSNYRYFGFMNFFQMPSLVRGLDIETSLYEAKGDATKEQIKDMYHDIIEKSSDVFNHVTNILKPQLIVFTSTRAYNAYEQYMKQKGLEIPKNVLGLDHAGCPWWNRKKGKYGNKSSKERLEEVFGTLKNDRCNFR